MLALFRRGGSGPAQLPGLGATVIAQPWPAGGALPAGCLGVAAGQDGRTRRIEHGAPLALAAGERCWCVHPGPYTADLLPFAAAPEIGLRTTFAIDSADPRVAQQRFDLYLAAEVEGILPLDVLARQMQAALAHELAQGGLALPPCTTFEEWNVFRAGLDQLLYTRFGASVDDCIPVDLGDTRDYAHVLLSGVAAPEPHSAPAAAPAPRHDDAAALRRLFLELPAVMGRVRLSRLPFAGRQALLERLDLLCLAAGTMPALALAAPGQPLAASAQVRRASHSRRAVAALDEAWALLARLELATPAGVPGLLDDASRIVANLEQACAARRAVEGAHA